MFVADKEAKIRSLFVMPSAKTSGERDGALHKIACCSISIQGGPQVWTWMGWLITMYPKNLHIYIYPNMFLGLTEVCIWSCSNMVLFRQITDFGYILSLHKDIATVRFNPALVFDMNMKVFSYRKDWLSWLPTSRNCQFGLFCPFLQMFLPSIGSHLLSAP